MLRILENLAQGTDEWREERRKYITASDVPRIIAFLKGNNFYTETPSDWFAKKMGKEEDTSDYKKDLYRKGHLSEERVKAERLSGEQYIHSEIGVLDDWILASLDSRNKEKNIIIELKYSTSQNAISEYRNKTHPNYYQLAAQMYVFGAEVGAIIISDGDSNEDIIKKFTVEDEMYQEFIKYLPEIKLVFEALQAGKNFFVKEEDINIRIQGLSDSILETKEKILELKERLKLSEEKMVELLNSDINPICKSPDGDSIVWQHSSYFRKSKKLKIGLDEEDVFDIEEKEYFKLKTTKI